MAFGEGPLSLPLLVEAAEDLFEPVAIRNNVEGYEREILQRYEEPTWNYPVVRFVDETGFDVISRVDHVWETGPLLARMVLALRTAQREVPEWMRILSAETHGGEVETAVFSML